MLGVLAVGVQRVLVVRRFGTIVPKAEVITARGDHTNARGREPDGFKPVSANGQLDITWLLPRSTASNNGEHKHRGRDENQPFDPC